MNYFRYFQVAEFQYVLLATVWMHFCTPYSLRRLEYTSCLWLYVQNAIQERQWEYNATMKRVRATIVVVENQWVLHNLNVCICSLRYPARNAHAPYCHLWPAPLYSILLPFLINDKIFEKKVTEYKMCILIFSTTFIWNISHSKNKWARYGKNVYWSSCKVPVILVRL